MSTDPITSPPDISGGGVLAAISNEMVRLHKDHLGRGPTKARTYFAGPNTLVTSTPPSRSSRKA